ncbi:MAG: phosphopentomutase [Ignavibacteria bacterium]|jgi:phosphopentomutase|nr:phosphopentomutase [Ignavibacteria bacterium]MCU7499170.1 phosphopentomutase [Ignavibacteria bacterium]MCU7512938.1 phosphopentomutase [Ignavibacteria bacterium]MCU7521475.1 phosphopentomutase [Ignavibacteria bacterium]MCU7526218.1 phosphopentomutase [Ignavibacteria bacterium]
MNNFVIIVLDGIGAGELPDAGKYNDTGSNTLANMARAVGGLNLPNLEAMGLGNITDIKGVSRVEKPMASYGKMNEVSNGKDSTTGHWEIGGIKVEFDFPYYPEGFPEELIQRFLKATGLKGVLGNKPASGTEIIKELGDEHVKTGFPIVYTSADSVFQIAAHESVIPLERLYEICKITRNEVLTGKDSAGRVIARPFIGESGNYTRTTNRKDYSLDPESDTILDVLSHSGITTVAIGKINDLFNYRGIKVIEKTKSNLEGIRKLQEYTLKAKDSLIFANLVDFDVYYGHRNDPAGFFKALREFDGELPGILSNLDESDCLIITSDHGNDPTDVSTDHTREYVPLLFYRKGKEGINLGIRETFSDVAQSAASFFRVDNSLKGTSFL